MQKVNCHDQILIQNNKEFNVKLSVLQIVVFIKFNSVLTYVRFLFALSV
jgi:hypothetical protein